MWRALGIGLVSPGEREVEGTARSCIEGNGDGAQGKTFCLGRGGSPSLEMGKTGLCEALWDPVFYWGQPSSGQETSQTLPRLSLGWTVAFCSLSFPVNEQAREDHLFAGCNQPVCMCGTALVRGGAFYFFLNCCSS